MKTALTNTSGRKYLIAAIIVLLLIIISTALTFLLPRRRLEHYNFPGIPHRSDARESLSIGL
jgi:hypothetical protein